MSNYVKKFLQFENVRQIKTISKSSPGQIDAETIIEMEVFPQGTSSSSIKIELSTIDELDKMIRELQKAKKEVQNLKDQTLRAPDEPSRSSVPIVSNPIHHLQANGKPMCDMSPEEQTLVVRFEEVLAALRSNFGWLDWEIRKYRASQNPYEIRNLDTGLCIRLNEFFDWDRLPTGEDEWEISHVSCIKTVRLVAGSSGPDEVVEVLKDLVVEVGSKAQILESFVQKFEE